jgi:hypothetical protein
MTAPEGEARRYRRFSIDVDATISLSGTPALKARARDLSRTGICLIGSSALERGSLVKLTLVLAFGTLQQSAPLVLQARVVWCTAIESSFQIGAMFEEVTEVQDTFLEMFLHFLDGTLAPKGAEDMEPDDEAAPPSPDVKDDPFR